MELLRAPARIGGARGYATAAAGECSRAELLRDDAWFDQEADYAIKADPVVKFLAISVQPLGLRICDARTSHFGGLFRVDLRLDPALDCSRYEYRQDIRGRASVQLAGSSSRLDMRNCFEVPGGLSPALLTEDGQILNPAPIRPVPPGHACPPLAGSIVERFGYRSSPPVVRAMGCPIFASLEDRYLPTQATGCRYVARDTYGVSIDRARLRGATLRLRLIWRGRVIDRLRGDRTIRTLHWGVRGRAIVA